MYHRSNYLVLDYPRRITLKDPAYEDKLVDWILSEYKDESQLLQFPELQNRFAEVEGKALKNEENLFLVNSSLKLYRELLKLDAKEEQKLAIIMLYFVETVQTQQLSKIPNPLAVAQDVILLTKGKVTLANTVYTALLESDRLVNRSYLEEMIRWFTSEEADATQLLTAQKLQQALEDTDCILTPVENSYLVRSMVYDLRRQK